MAIQKLIENGGEQSASDCMQLLANFVDREETIFSAELHLLRKVAGTSSDLVKARDWPEFCAACGGLQKMENEHSNAVRAYEQWIADGEG